MENDHTRFGAHCQRGHVSLTQSTGFNPHFAESFIPFSFLDTFLQLGSRKICYFYWLIRTLWSRLKKEERCTKFRCLLLDGLLSLQQ
ncbi:hypothetical protein Pfo_014951 [Paulownia fortunei]|nr:hypothetical protein Pfo_014951 [Paulownia fortunei]